MSDSLPPPPIPAEVASAQEPWPAASAVGEVPEPCSDAAVSQELAPGRDDAPDELATGSILARVAADRLSFLATPVQVGIVVLGTLGAFNGLGGSGRATSSREALTFLLTVGSLVVGGLVARLLLNGFAALLLAQADQAEAAGRTEQHVAAGLAQLAMAIESLATLPRGGAGAPAATALETKVQHLAEIRQAVRSGHWAEADELLRTFNDAYPGDSDGPHITTHVADARQAAGQELLARIEAAREVNDPERVIELREALEPLLAPEALRALDRDLARWFLLLIHRRLRAGTARADVAVLAARVADCLDDTPEGASLRASLPTLRRAAGLCPRCGQPFKGVADVCPTCLANPRPAGVPHPPLPPLDGPPAGPAE